MLQGQIGPKHQHRLTFVQVCDRGQLAGLAAQGIQQRYNIAGRIARALKLAKLYLDPLPAGQPVRNMVDDHGCWLETRLNNEPSTALEYRKAKSSDQLRIAEDLPELKTTAGVLLVDAQGHGLISAKIASTVHDTFHALMLVELDRYGKTTPGFLEKINLRLPQSVPAQQRARQRI